MMMKRSTEDDKKHFDQNVILGPVDPHAHLLTVQTLAFKFDKHFFYLLESFPPEQTAAMH